MSLQFFGRRADLSVIGQVINRQPDGSLVVEESQDEATVFPSELEDGSPGYRIQFSVDRSNSYAANPSEISIYNLGQASRQAFQKINSRIVLRAGYGEDLQQIFTGNIQRTRTEKVGPDFITKIRAADGLFAFQGAQINQSFGQPTSLSDAISSLGDSFAQVGIGLDTSAGLPTKTYQSGIVLSGNTAQQLQKIISSEGLEFSIQDNNVVILPVGASRGTSTFVLSTDTGMVGIPQIGENSMTVTSLLNPRLKVYENVLVRSKFVNGIYRIVKAVHKGDTFQGDFFTELETDIAREDLGTI